MESKTQIKVSEPEKRILETLRIEFFPILNKLKDLLIQIQKYRLLFYVFSAQLPKFENEYFNISSEFSPEILSGSENFKQKLTSLVAAGGSIMNIRLYGNMREVKHTVLPSPSKIIEKGINLFLEGAKDILK